MDTKKDKCKFTIQFSSTDACHLQAVEILNAQGRRKAQFITNAILHYSNPTKSVLMMRYRKSVKMRLRPSQTLWIYSA